MASSLLGENEFVGLGDFFVKQQNLELNEGAYMLFSTSLITSVDVSTHLVQASIAICEEITESSSTIVTINQKFSCNIVHSLY